MVTVKVEPKSSPTRLRNPPWDFASNHSHNFAKIRHLGLPRARPEAAGARAHHGGQLVRLNGDVTFVSPVQRTKRVAHRCARCAVCFRVASINR